MEKRPNSRKSIFSHVPVPGFPRFSTNQDAPGFSYSWFRLPISRVMIEFEPCLLIEGGTTRFRKKATRRKEKRCDGSNKNRNAKDDTL
jgi:hypothetical protein